MHLALRQAVGDNLADMLIEHLPPFEWTDIARQSDLLALRADVDMIKVDISAMKTSIMRLEMSDQSTNTRIDHLHSELVSFRDETNRRFDALEKRVNVVITAGLAFGLAMLALQVQIVLSLANI